MCMSEGRSLDYADQLVAVTPPKAVGSHADGEAIQRSPLYSISSFLSDMRHQTIHTTSPPVPTSAESVGPSQQAAQEGTV